MDKKYILGVFIAYLLAITVLQINSLSSTSVNLGKYSKKLNGIYQRNENEMKVFNYVNDKVLECKKANKTYTVLPSNPYIHWIYNDYPTLSLDWVSNVEMLNQKARLKKEISQVDCVILDPYYEFWKNKRFGFDSEEMLGIKLDTFIKDITKEK